MNRRFAIKSIVATLASLVGLKKEPELFVVETPDANCANDRSAGNGYVGNYLAIERKFV